MLLTKECDYGIRIIRALAGYEKKTVEAICDSEHVPAQYAYKILKKLEHNGFVQSWRGRDGGYQLIKPSHTFTLYDIVHAVNENLFIFECLREDVYCSRNDPKQLCSIYLELERIQKSLTDEMQRKTMDKLLS